MDENREPKVEDNRLIEDLQSHPTKKRAKLICPMRSSHVGNNSCAKEDCAWWVKHEYESSDSVEGCCVPIGIDAIERSISAIEDYLEDDEEEFNEEETVPENMVCAGCGDPIEEVGFIRKDGKYFCMRPCEPGDDEILGDE